MEVVERVEELGLGLFGPSEELHVVQEQDIDVAVLPLEEIALSLPDGLDELGHEALGGGVPDPCVWGELPGVVGDGKEQVGLPQSDSPVDEHGVVRLGGRCLRHGQGRGMGELVAGPGDERVEGVAVRKRACFGAGDVASRGSNGLRFPAGFGLPRGPADPDSHPDVGAENLAGGAGHEFGVVRSQPILHVGVGHQQLHDVGAELSGPQVGEPQVERGLGELPPGPRQDGLAHPAGGRTQSFGGRLVSDRRRHVSTDTFHRCGNGRPSRRRWVASKRGGL